MARRASASAWRAAGSNSARQLLLERATSALAQLVEEDPPEALVNSELRNRAESLVSSLQAQGVTMEQYMAMTGQEPATLTEGLTGAATTRGQGRPRAARRGRCRGASRSATTTWRPSTQRIAVRVNQKPNQVRKAYERNDAVSGLRGEIRKAKALEWLLRHVEIVDTEGQPIDRELLLPPDEELVVPARSTPPARRTTTTTTTPVTTTTTHGHDHDHDHPPTDEAENP